MPGAATPEIKPPAFRQGEAGGGQDTWLHGMGEKVLWALNTWNQALYFQPRYSL